MKNLTFCIVRLLKMIQSLGRRVRKPFWLTFFAHYNKAKRLSVSLKWSALMNWCWGKDWLLERCQRWERVKMVKEHWSGRIWESNWKAWIWQVRQCQRWALHHPAFLPCQWGKYQPVLFSDDTSQKKSKSKSTQLAFSSPQHPAFPSPAGMADWPHGHRHEFEFQDARTGESSVLILFQLNFLAWCFAVIWQEMVTGYKKGNSDQI